MESGGSTTLLGRDRELALLGEAVDRAWSGTGSVWMIQGEPGVGKTALATEIVQGAVARGASTAIVTAWDHGGAPPFWPWTRVLRSLADPRVGPLAAAATALAEALRGAAPHDDHDRFELFDEVLTMVRSLAAHRPLVVLLDDLHAADQATVLLLRFVAQGIGDAPVVLLGTYRQVELLARPDLGGAGLAHLRDASRTGGTIELDGLAVEDVDGLLTRTLGRRPVSALVDRVHALTRGNPLFVRYLAPQVGAAEGLDRFDVPDGIRSVIEERLDRVDPPERDVLRLAALVGTSASRRLVERLAVSRPDAAVSACPSAARLELVRVDDDAIELTHPLVREVLVDEIAPGRREELHGRVADLLADDADTAQLGEVAHHLLRAGPARVLDAVRASHEAARRAVATTAFEDAIGLLRQALAAIDGARPIDGSLDGARFELLVELGRTCWRAGRRAECDVVFDEAWRVATLLDEPDALARAALGGGFTKAFTVSYPNERVERCRIALDRIGDGDSATRSLLLAKLASELVGHPDQGLARAAATGALALARRLGDDRCLGEALAAVMVTELGPAGDDRRAMADEMLAIAERRNDRALAVQARFQLVGTLVELGDRAELDAVIAAQHREVDALAEPSFLRHDVWFRAMSATVDGDIGRAEQLIDEGLRAAELAADPDGALVWGGQLGVVRWMQGRVDELEPMYREMASSSNEPVWPAILAWLWSRHGLRDAARGMLERALAGGVDSIPRDRHWLLTMSTAAEAAARLEEVEAAETVRASLWPYADRMVPIAMGVSYWGTVARPLAMVELSLGRPEAAIELFESAVRSTRRFGALPWLAEVQLDLAAALLDHRSTDGAVARARATIDEAAGLADRLGLVEIAERASRLQARTRGAAGAPASVDPDGGSSPTAQRRPTVRVMGRFGCTDVTGSEVVWNSRKARSVLKLLVDARGNRVPRDVLCDRLWPGVPSSVVSNRLAVAIATIRRALDPGRELDRAVFVGADRDTVWLDVDRVDVDLVRFVRAADAARQRVRSADGLGDPVEVLRELRDAAASYGGTPFADEPYDDRWAGAREEVRSAYADLCHAIADIAGRAGLDSVAVSALRDALDADPYDLHAHRALIALHRSRGAHGLAELAERRLHAVMGDLAC